jgi:hypothetical protein
LAPAIRASAGDLPLRDGAVDAAMTILSLHHWDEEQERGVRAHDGGLRLIVGN